MKPTAEERKALIERRIERAYETREETKEIDTIGQLIPDFKMLKAVSGKVYCGGDVVVRDQSQ